MPLRNSNLSTLTPDPTVRIFLHGQLILEPASDSSKCDVGINRCSPNHQFSIEVRQKFNNPEIPDLIHMRHLGSPEVPGIEIDVDPPSMDGVRKFVPTINFNRQDPWPDQSPEAHDLRWIVDLAGGEFHAAELEVNGNGTEPNIQIKDGLFYTARRTDDRLIGVSRTTRTKGTQPDLDLHRIASIIGVNIYANKANLIFTNNGKPNQKVEMERDAESYYEIRINNDPLFIPKPDPDEPDPLPSHKELKEYYKVIDSVIDPNTGDPDEDFTQFELVFSRKESPSLGSPRIPCMPIGSGT
jgi:hypothetical protein